MWVKPGDLSQKLSNNHPYFFGFWLFAGHIYFMQNEKKAGAQGRKVIGNKGKINKKGNFM